MKLRKIWLSKLRNKYKKWKQMMIKNKKNQLNTQMMPQQIKRKKKKMTMKEKKNTKLSFRNQTLNKLSRATRKLAIC